MKKVSSIILALIILLSNSVLAEIEEINIEVKEEKLVFYKGATIVEGQILVPLREELESLGYDIFWDGLTRTVIGKDNNNLVELKIDDGSASINGKLVKTNIPIRIINQKTLVAVKFIEEIKGGDIDWNKNTNILAPRMENKDLGRVESIIGYGPNVVVGAHYPVFGKNNIDATNKELVNSYIEDFKKRLEKNYLADKDYKCGFNIDYEIYKGPNNSASVTFNIIEKSSYLVDTYSESETRVYDLTNDKELDAMPSSRIIDPNKPMIALTFDDGPNRKTTIPILDTLKKYDSAATFFVLGNRVSSNEDILKRMVEEGSEIGNHSYNHKELTRVSSIELMKQITNTQNAIINAVDIEPRIMRPTYGSYNNNMKSQIKMPLILWSVDTLDWKSRNSRKVENHVIKSVKDGDIILMHDIYASTAEAVKSLVPKLIEMGYQLVTVSELFEIRGDGLKDGHIYNFGL